MIGFGDRSSAALAVIVNGGMADALDYDDTHNETHLHAGAHVVPTALAVGEWQCASGRDVITAVAGGYELGCRMAVVAPGQFVRNGFHTSSIVGTLTTAFMASRMLGLDLDQTCNTIGTAGSQAGGILECYTDGTWTQGLHPGWFSHAGITAALLGRAGFLGPDTVIEGRMGLFRSHVQDPDYAFDFDRMLADLGRHWESRYLSLKLYPTGCVIHPYLDAILHLYREEGLRAADVKSITMPMSPHWVNVVCEPVAEKKRPKTEFAARISLHYAVAEALHFGKLGLDSFAERNLSDPEILALVDRADYVVDENPPPRRQFDGHVIVETTDGRRLERAEKGWNKGHHDNPETLTLVREKFHENAVRALPKDQVERIVEKVSGLEQLDDVGALIDLCVT